MINTDRLAEGIDYEFVPSSDDDKAWSVRMLTGPFPETVIQFGKLEVDGKEESINFDFMVVESPEEDLTPDNTDLQEACGSVLFFILEDSLTNGTADIVDRNDE
jgi:hypothetical protein